MKELMVLLASAVPQEKLIEDLQEAASEAKLFPTKENVDHLLMQCQMFIINHATDGKLKNASEMIKEMDKFEKRNKLFQTDSN